MSPAPGHHRVQEGPASWAFHYGPYRECTLAPCSWWDRYRAWEPRRAWEERQRTASPGEIVTLPLEATDPADLWAQRIMGELERWEVAWDWRKPRAEVVARIARVLRQPAP